MTSVAALTGLLIAVLGSTPENRLTLIRQFQEAVWNEPDLGGSAAALDVLRELAYDLDFFEPDEAVRKEAQNYYGEDRLAAEICQALEKLKSEASGDLAR